MTALLWWSGWMSVMLLTTISVLQVCLCSCWYTIDLDIIMYSWCNHDPLCHLLVQFSDAKTRYIKQYFLWTIPWVISILVHFTILSTFLQLSFSSSSLHVNWTSFIAYSHGCYVKRLAFASVKYVIIIWTMLKICVLFSYFLTINFVKGRKMCLIFRDSSFAHAFLFFFFHNEEEATWKAICVFCKFVIILLLCSLDSCSVLQHLGRSVSSSGLCSGNDGDARSLFSVFQQWILQLVKLRRSVRLEISLVKSTNARN